MRGSVNNMINLVSLEERSNQDFRAQEVFPIYLKLSLGVAAHLEVQIFNRVAHLEVVTQRSWLMFP